MAQRVSVAEAWARVVSRAASISTPRCRLIEATERKQAGEPDPGGPWHQAHMEFA